MPRTLLYVAQAGILTTSNLSVVDPCSGAVVPGGVIGPIGRAITGLALHPGTGVLYGGTSRQSAVDPNSLITINRISGAGTLVGRYHDPLDPNSLPASASLTDLTFRDGILYGWSVENVNRTGNIYTVNLLSGKATIVGKSFLGFTRGGALSANSAGTLFLSEERSSGPLRTVDPATGITTIVGTLNGDVDRNMKAFSFDQCNNLYGVMGRLDDGGGGDGNGILVTVNTVPVAGINQIRRIGTLRDANGPLPYVDAIATFQYCPPCRHHRHRCCHRHQ